MQHQTPLPLPTGTGRSTRLLLRPPPRETRRADDTRRVARGVRAPTQLTAIRCKKCIAHRYPDIKYRRPLLQQPVIIRVSRSAACACCPARHLMRWTRRLAHLDTGVLSAARCDGQMGKMHLDRTPHVFPKAGARLLLSGRARGPPTAWTTGTSRLDAVAATAQRKDAARGSRTELDKQYDFRQGSELTRELGEDPAKR